MEKTPKKSTTIELTGMLLGALSLGVIGGLGLVMTGLVSRFVCEVFMLGWNLL